ncbi:thiamine diphosphokinase [Sphingobacterium sp. DR205]|uniref:thiamine diphosphokinase n=1 Tax=Sphingobacterium sp. DR205 TaxID=2713573 RepID=UPI0013E4EB99|nr:thiamine diphosphokinase [Sphingobacterium sp. DR205]QIH31412.1 thiamine diphosphokinase [Sphingobacterium sp. DR205]
MSSHHIVRENQEPALLIEDLFLIEEEDLGQLLEWSPSIVIENNLVDQLDARGYKFDVVFAQNHIEPLQENLKVIPYRDNFLQSAIEYLVEHQYKAVNIITDQISLAHYQRYLDLINVVLLARGMRYYFVTTGFTKWKVGGEQLKIDSQGEEIVTEGLRKIDENLYETEKDGLFKLGFSESKYILIGETIA